MMIANHLLAQLQEPSGGRGNSSTLWLVVVLIIAIAAASLILFAAWANRRWRKK